MRVSDALAELDVEMQVLVLLRSVVNLLPSPATGVAASPPLLMPSLVVLRRGSEVRLTRAHLLADFFKFLRILISVAVFSHWLTWSMGTVLVEAADDLAEFIDQLEAITAADVELWGDLVDKLLLAGVERVVFGFGHFTLDIGVLGELRLVNGDLLLLVAEPLDGILLDH